MTDSQVEEIELPTFEEWLLMEYPLPDPEKDDYAEYALNKWGLYAALSHVYPHVFGAYGKTHKQIYDEQRQKYYWYCIDAVVSGVADTPPEIDEGEFLEWLIGLPIVTTSKTLELSLERKLPAGSHGVELWDENPGSLCLFGLGEDLELKVLKSHEFIGSDAEFSDWGDLE